MIWLLKEIHSGFMSRCLFPFKQASGSVRIVPGCSLCRFSSSLFSLFWDFPVVFCSGSQFPVSGLAYGPEWWPFPRQRGLWVRPEASSAHVQWGELWSQLQAAPPQTHTPAAQGKGTGLPGAEWSLPPWWICGLRCNVTELSVGVCSLGACIHESMPTNLGHRAAQLVSLSASR